MTRRLALLVALFAVSLASLSLALNAEGRPLHHHHHHGQRHHRRHHRHHAHRASRHVAPIDVALGKAKELWGVAPCGGRFVVAYDLEGNGGLATFQTPTGPGYYDDPVAVWTDCVLHLNAAEWTATNVERDWPQLCTIVLHESGHLTGHVHSDEPEFANAPDTRPETPEQIALMRSGAGSYEDDLARCGWSP